MPKPSATNTIQKNCGRTTANIRQVIATTARTIPLGTSPSSDSRSSRRRCRRSACRRRRSIRRAWRSTILSAISSALSATRADASPLAAGPVRQPRPADCGSARARRSRAASSRRAARPPSMEAGSCAAPLAPASAGDDSKFAWQACRTGPARAAGQRPPSPVRPIYHPQSSSGSPGGARNPPAVGGRQQTHSRRRRRKGPRAERDRKGRVERGSTRPRDSAWDDVRTSTSRQAGSSASRSSCCCRCGRTSSSCRLPWGTRTTPCSSGSSHRRGSPAPGP